MVSYDNKFRASLRVSALQIPQNANLVHLDVLELTDERLENLGGR